MAKKTKLVISQQGAASVALQVQNLNKTIVSLQQSINTLNTMAGRQATAMTRMARTMGQTANATKTANQSGKDYIKTLQRKIITAGATVGSLWAMYKTIQGLLGPYRELIRVGTNTVSVMEESKLGIASLVNSFASLQDVQGQMLSSDQKWQASMDISTRMQRKLRASAIETAAEYEDLLLALQEGIGPAINAGFSENQIVQFTQRMAQVAAAIRLPMDQLGQEIRAVFEGDMSRNSRITRLIFQDLERDLKGSGKTVREWVKEMTASGQFWDEFNKRTDSFLKAGELAANTWNNSMSNLRDAAKGAIEQAFTPAVKAATASIKQMTDWLVQIDPVTKKMTFNPSFVKTTKALADMFADSAAALERWLPAIVEVTGHLPVLVKQFQSIFAVLRNMSSFDWKVFAINPLYKGVQMWRDAAHRLEIDALMQQTPSQQRMAAARVGQEALRSATGLETFRTREYVTQSTPSAGVRPYGVASPTTTEVAVVRDEAGMLIAELMGRESEAFVKLVMERVKETVAKRDTPEVQEFLRESGIVRQAGKVYADEVQEAINFVDASLGDDALGVVNALEDDMAAAAEAAEKYRRALRELSEGFREVSREAERFNEEQRKLIESNRKWMLDIGRDESTILSETYISGIQNRIASLESGPLTAENIRELATAYEDLAEAQRSMAETELDWQVADDNARLQEQRDALNESALAQERLNAELDRLLELKAAGVWKDDDLKDLDKEIANIQENLKQLAQERPELIEQIAALEAVLDARRQARQAQINQEYEQGRIQAEKKINEKINELTQLQLASLHRRYDRFFNDLSRAWGDGVSTLFDTGDVEESFQSLVDGFRDMWKNAFIDIGNDWLETVSKMAKGEMTDAQGNAISVAGISTQQGAKNFMTAMTAFSAIANIVQNQGPTRRQNVTAGAMTGLSAGASIGAMYGTGGGAYGIVVGAVIGAIAGALLGSMAPTLESKTFQVQIRNGELMIRGGKNVKTREVEEALRDANRTIRQSRFAIRGILETLPIDVLSAVWDNLDPKMPDTPFIEFNSKTAVDALRDFIENKLPDAVITSFVPAIHAAGKALGVDEKKMKQITDAMKTMGIDEAKQLLMAFFQNIVQIGEIVEFYEKSMGAKYDALRPKTITSQIDELDKRIALMGQGLEDLSLEDQIARGEQLRDLINERYQLELDYLRRIKEAADAINESIDQQITGLRRSLMTPEEEGLDILAEQRRLRDQLASATTPEEVQRIVGLMQANVSRLVELASINEFGELDPEKQKLAVQQGIAMLEDIRAVSQARLKEFEDELKTRDDLFTDMITKILETLQQGLEGVFRDGGNGGGGTGGGDGSDSNIGGGGKEGTDPQVPLMPRGGGGRNQTVGENAMDRLTQSALDASEALHGLTDNIVVNVTVQPQVTVAGTAEQLIDRVITEATTRSVNATFAAQARRGARKRGW